MHESGVGPPEVQTNAAASYRRLPPDSSSGPTKIRGLRPTRLDQLLVLRLSLSSGTRRVVPSFFLKWQRHPEHQSTTLQFLSHGAGPDTHWQRLSGVVWRRPECFRFRSGRRRRELRFLSRNQHEQIVAGLGRGFPVDLAAVVLEVFADGIDRRLAVNNRIFQGRAGIRINGDCFQFVSAAATASAVGKWHVSVRSA